MTLYDGSVGALAQFLDEVQCRANDSGWNQDLLTISDWGMPAMQCHLITTHRHLSLDDVCFHAMQYVGQPTHTAQDAVMMFAFLCDSPTSEVRSQVTLEVERYTINGTANGPCFLKAVLIKFHVEMNATNFHLRTRLITLPKTIITLNKDIALFNSTVQEITKELAAGGQASTDMMLIYLFLEYQEAEDKDFVDFIKHLKMRYK